MGVAGVLFERDCQLYEVYLMILMEDDDVWSPSCVAVERESVDISWQVDQDGAIGVFAGDVGCKVLQDAVMPLSVSARDEEAVAVV